MANLVSPGFNRSSLVNELLVPYEQRILEFKGLNRRSAVEEGEMSEMKNLTSDNYPLLTPRKLRGEHALPEGVITPYSIITKFDRIAMIAEKTNGNVAFFYDGAEVTAVTGMTADTQMVAINTKICFFPQKSYLTLQRGESTVTVGEFGYLEQSVTYSSYKTVDINSTDTRIKVGSHSWKKGDVIDIDGTILDVDNNGYISDSDTTRIRICTQSDGTGGDITIPSGTHYICLKKRGSTDLWVVAVNTVPFTLRSYKINNGQLETERVASKKGDYYVAYAHYYSPVPTPTTTKEWFTVNASAIPADVGLSLIMGFNVKVSAEIKDVTTDTIVIPRETFIELVASGLDGGKFTGTVKRELPNLKYVTEWNNRLWGVSDADNTVYACKLGDPTNWKYYQGTSIDSYYAQQGTDGKWTGCAPYSGHLIFFKQNSMCKIYGTSPSRFQVTNTVCYGVKEGSSKSVTIINDTVLYHSMDGIMAYEGGTPYSISNKLNGDFRNVIGGTDGRKYYASVEHPDGTHEILVLDVERAVWHREDNARFRDCCTYDGKLFFISAEASDSCLADRIYVINPETATETLAQREWMAVFGPLDENVESQKIFSKVSIRFIAQPNTVVDIFIKMDSGEWEQIKHFEYAETFGETVPIVPRRCDRFSIKIVGSGDCEIKSLTRRCRRGSELEYGHNRV